MKAITILEWIIEESICGEQIGIVDVPEEGDNEWQQNEEWWCTMFGNCPPSPMPSGKYLYYYESQIDYTIDHKQPDAQIEIPTASGFDYINLYKIEEQ